MLVYHTLNITPSCTGALYHPGPLSLRSREEGHRHPLGAMEKLHLHGPAVHGWRPGRILMLTELEDSYWCVSRREWMGMGEWDYH